MEEDNEPKSPTEMLLEMPVQGLKEFHEAMTTEQILTLEFPDFMIVTALPAGMTDLGEAVEQAQASLAS